ncbi:hypothetical protein [Streptococcus massiliensis]|uniref:Glycosyl transferase family protein n=1 Tax=Streptococcus massiliensis TaxID=313439 RepID=A0A380KYL4_9STRE|nr:hypothetical protein [Streptococcus massiliensis]SUN75660.1 glycosyl transferase family protein [Streptococcus massiliensis]
MFRGKRFLLTHIWLRGFGGAELNILELATFLKRNGAEVEVFTFLLLSPLAEEFTKNGITVIDDIDHSFTVSDYDYIWCAQNILPPAIVQELMNKQTKLPKFAFFHMAALEDHVLEQPYIHQLETKLSSSALAISEEIIEKNLSRYFTENENIVLYQNPAPSEYGSYTFGRKTLKKIMVISNHPPKELLDLSEVFQEKDIVVDYYGVWSDKYELASPELFLNYDCVIGIGKNVQYCLTIGIPIYIYDHFNGPGFLNEENFALAEKHNFSGRGFEQLKRTSKEIAEEILVNFEKTREFQMDNLATFRDKFLMDHVIKRVIDYLDKQNKEIKAFDLPYASYVQAMILLIKNTVVRLDNDVVNLWKQIDVDKNEINILNEQLLALEENRDYWKSEQEKLYKEIGLIKVSRSYRFFEKLRQLRKRTKRK